MRSLNFQIKFLILKSWTLEIVTGWTFDCIYDRNKIVSIAIEAIRILPKADFQTLN